MKTVITAALLAFTTLAQANTACGLNNIQVLGDDDAFTGRQAADKVFGAVVSADSPFEDKSAKPVDAEVDDMFA